MDQEKIGKFIKQLRKENKMTQQNLADILEITDKAVSKWENGRCLPDLYFINKLCELFKITEKEFLNGERDYKKKSISSDKKVLEIKKLSKTIKKKKILDDINIDIFEGEIVGLVGPNGSGKTTIIKTILSLYSKNEGTVQICGKDFNENIEQSLSKIGCVFDQASLYEELTGKQNIEIAETMCNLNDEEYKSNIIKELKLEEIINKKVKEYSLGTKQRLSIAISLIKKPKLLLLDEPINALDPEGIKILRNILTKCSEEKIGVLISSHILKELENMCDKIVIINKGKIIKVFGIEEVKFKNISLEEEYFKIVLGEKNENY